MTNKRMRTLYRLTILIFLPFILYGNNRPYSGSEERKAARIAYELLKVYYPDSLCVKDSIYDLDWYSLPYVDEKTQDELQAQMINNLVSTPPTYSKFLNKEFGKEICNGCNDGYYIMFAEPRNGMIRCEVHDGSKKTVGKRGVSKFLLSYYEDGESYQLDKELCSPLISFDQNPPYSEKAAQIAVKSAYDMIKVFYPDELCVSDSIYDLFPIIPSGIDKATRDELYLFLLNQEALKRPTFFSEELHESLDNCICKECTSGYVVMFGLPYKNLLMCEVRPWQRRYDSIYFGTSTEFIFRFDNEGIIYQALKSEVIVN